MVSKVGRASVPPERLLKASLYLVRSERAFCEELEYNLLFRWFLEMNLMERSFDPTVFTKNRKRLLETQDRTGAVRRGGVGGGPSGTAVGRALQRGRDADRGGGQHQELQTER